MMIGNRAAGRLTIELFDDLTFFTSENFRGLCTGDYGKGSSGVLLSYQESVIFKVIPGKYLIGGDIISNTGRDGDSVYGRSFIDEDFSRKHSGIGLVSTYSRGPNTNTSSFVITLGECQELDDRCVVFGQVLEGINVLKSIEKTATDALNRPKVPIRVFNCGQLEDGREHIKFEEFRDQINIYRAYEERKAQKKEEHLKKYYDLLKTKEIDEAGVQEVPQVEIVNEPEEDIEEEGSFANEEIAARYARLKAKLKNARKFNDTAVADELKKQSDPAWEKKQKKKEWEMKERESLENLEALGITKEKAYLIDNIAHVGNMDKKQKKKAKRSAYGWDVFNTDALLRGYKRRLAKVDVDKEEAKKQSEDKSIVIVEPDIKRIERMAEELEEEAERRKKFSRRRPFYQDYDISFINERNRVYNSKLERNFKEYAAELKGNLERGTSL